jgi:hypothetical protein
MWNNNDPSRHGGGGGTSPLNKSIDGLSLALAIVATFLAAPQLFALTSDWAVEHFRAAYGYQYDPSLVAVGWGSAVALVIFWITRIFFFLALTAIAVSAAGLMARGGFAFI